MSSRYCVSLEFAGLNEGVDELTWGQRFVWNILHELAPANHYINIRFVIDLPGNVSVERVLSSLENLICRYEALRTRYGTGTNGQPLQRLEPEGTFLIEVCDTDQKHPRDLAKQRAEELWSKPFDHELDWPMRACVIVNDGRPRHIALAFSHLAIDAWGCHVFCKELLALLSGHQIEKAEGLSALGWQPRARAEFESSSLGRKANDRSMTYWRNVLHAMPQTAFPAMRNAWECPRFPGTRIESVALALATQELAARHRVSPTTILLAAVSSLLGIRSRSKGIPLFLAAGNRFSPHDKASVGTFYQGALALMRLDTDSFVETVRRSHEASTLAYLRGQSDPQDLATLIDSVNVERGVDIDLSSTINIVPQFGGPSPAAGKATRAELQEIAETSQLSSLEGRDSEQLKFYLHVQALRQSAVLDLFSDSRFLGSAEARQFLHGLERVLVEIVGCGDLSIAQMAELTGIEPFAQSGSFTTIDNCWIDLGAVRNLLFSVDEVVASNVFVTDSLKRGPQLTAYVVSRTPITPEVLHATLLGKLKGGVAAMTPHRYIICHTIPKSSDNLVDWERQPVRVEGSGRVSTG